MKGGILILTVLAMLVAFVGGCKVQLDKSRDGGGDHVKIATPFGAIAVNKNAISAAEVGVPAYPGSVAETADDGNKSAKVDMGFGSWKLRVRVANFVTMDRQDQVVNFYRQALSEYGTVIECAGQQPVGAPAATGEGLTCDHSDHLSTEHGNSVDLQLKAGSPRHQHLVVFHRKSSSATHFSLIALDLPHGSVNEQEGTN